MGVTAVITAATLVGGLLFAPSVSTAVPPALPDPESNIDPQDVLDEESERNRALRREAEAQSGQIASSKEQATTTTPSLLGELLWDLY